MSVCGSKVKSTQIQHRHRTENVNTVGNFDYSLFVDFSSGNLTTQCLHFDVKSFFFFLEVGVT